MESGISSIVRRGRSDSRVTGIVNDISMQHGHFGPITLLVRIQIDHNTLTHFDLFPTSRRVPSRGITETTMFPERNRCGWASRH